MIYKVRVYIYKSHETQHGSWPLKTALAQASRVSTPLGSQAYIDIA